MTTSPPVTGQDLGVAQNATRALLDTVLARAGTDFPEWAVLNLLAQHGGALERQALRDQLAAPLQLHPSTADLLLDRTAARGYVQRVDDVHVGLTESGTARRQSLSEAVAGLTTELYQDFDPADLVVTGRVLRELATRATAMAMAA